MPVLFSVSFPVSSALNSLYHHLSLPLQGVEETGRKGKPQVSGAVQGLLCSCLLRVVNMGRAAGVWKLEAVGAEIPGECRTRGSLQAGFWVQAVQRTLLQDLAPLIK